MADLICRWRNGTPRTVVELVNSLPHSKMTNEAFREYMQHSQWGNDFFRTPYQLACQLGLYCEAEDGYYYPRFNHDISEQEAQDYLEFWMPRYYVPNPYVGRNGFNDIKCPTYVLYELYTYTKNHANCSYKEAYKSVFLEEPTNNNDIVKNYINNYSKVLFFDSDGYLNITEENPLATFSFMDRNNKKEFFDAFSRSDSSNNIDQPHQQIFYGAPGTGKSHEVKEKTRGKIVIRTTFHPDSDYSTFVGCYKPAMKENIISKNGETTRDEQIVYRFVPQAFTRAYTTAWNTEEDVFLVIEEINRGNCAQIFGDLFQLLDRKEGVSEYPVEADSDMANYIRGELVNSNRTDFPEGVKEGKRLVLPSNLYIWATMNTSDQSLFPIDSAFKRRWDWKYMPIEDAGMGWMINVNEREYNWYHFLEVINKEVLTLTGSEDKQLGYFFAKAKNGVIDADTLVNKVYFYLWTDVFKDCDYDSQKAFRKPNSNEPIAFKDFFEGREVNSDMAEQILINLGLYPIGAE